MKEMNQARKEVRAYVASRNGEYDLSGMHRVAIESLRKTDMPDSIVDSMALQAARDVFFSPKRKRELLDKAHLIFTS